MKKILFPLLALALLVSCSKEVFNENIIPAASETAIDYSAPEFNALFNAESTKTYLGTDAKLHWTAQDRVTVFAGSDANSEYVFCGETGDRSGTLMKVLGSSASGSTSLSANWAVYPYDPEATVDGDGVISYNLPSVQKYAAGSFGPESNTMVATTEAKDDYNLSFKNVGGYLVVRLYGNVVARKVTLYGNNDEKIAGGADITAVKGEAPTVAMHSDALTSISIDCGEGIALGNNASTATEFWFVVPPTTFNNGFTIRLEDTEGRSFCKSTSRKHSISRNIIAGVAAFSVSTTPGEFVRTLCPAETYTTDKVIDIVKQEYDISQYETLIKTALKLVSLNGDQIVNRIVYTTTDPQGNVVEASGVIAYKKGLKTYSKILSIQHVTVDIDEAPSSMALPFELGMAFKKGNEVVVEADYLGYGVSQTSDLQHPYIHSDLTGTACADMLKASETFITSNGDGCPGLKRNSKVTIDLMGYSQGGAATISTLLELEKRGGYTIGSVKAGGGPYDLEYFMDMIIQGKTYNRPEFIAYLIRGLVYGDQLTVDWHNIFANQVFTSGAFDRFSTTYVSSWASRLSTDMTKVLHQDFFGEFNPDVEKLANSVKNSSLASKKKPVNASKIQLYHSKKDEVIPYNCSEALKSNWGCSLNTLDKESHTKAAIEFYVKDFSTIVWNLIKDMI